MMEAVSGSVTAAGIYLKVAAGMDKGSEMGEEREVKGERDGCVMKGEIWLKWGRIRHRVDVWGGVSESEEEAEITSWSKLHSVSPVSSVALTI